MVRFHENAKEWLTQSLSEDDWRSIMDEDTHHLYSDYPTSKPPDIQHNSPPGEENSSPHGSTDSQYRFDESDFQSDITVETQGSGSNY